MSVYSVAGFYMCQCTVWQAVTCVSVQCGKLLHVSVYSVASCYMCQFTVWQAVTCVSVQSGRLFLQVLLKLYCQSYYFLNWVYVDVLVEFILVLILIF